ncbi:MAG TPA: recombination regulator RecX [Bacillota bacterium]|nr:recombination regulator RecX [Bacillota bacterium]
MPVISRITTQQKNKERYNIFLNQDSKETFGFSVDESVLIEYHLHKGLELDQATIDELMKKDEEEKAYNMVIHYLSYRMRTEKEIVDYLTKKDIPETHIAAIMEKLTQKKLINDNEFAEAFVRTRMGTSTKGPRLIQKELLEKGITDNIAAQALKQYTYKDQFNQAQKLLKKKLNQRTKHSHRQKIERIQNNLLQKGFSQDIVKEVVASHAVEKDETEEWEAIVHHGTKQLRKLQRKYDGHELENKLKESLYRKGFPFTMIQSFLEDYVEEQPE